MNKFQIMNVPMNASECQRLRFVVTNEEQQGWQPTKNDIKELLYSYRHQSKEITNTVNRLIKRLRKDK